jgi:4-carboxymuconolactone decarboxylase
MRDSMMMPGHVDPATLGIWSDELRALVRLAAAIAGGSEADVRLALTDAATVRIPWVEEVILQSYLFAGFPRALNAAREWRKLSGHPAPSHDPSEDYRGAEEWRVAGEATCATVYGTFYEPLRRNIRHLHPALDAWMIVEGYGKVLSRPGLDLGRRELCIVAACLAARQDRQLHAHLHGALNAGVSVADLRAAIAGLDGVVPAESVTHGHHLLSRVVGS